MMTIKEKSKKETINFDKAPEPKSTEKEIKEKITGLVKNRLAGLLNPETIWFTAGAVVFISILWFWFGSFGLLPTGELPLTAGSKWQAVTLVNGQIYFGHLGNYNRKFALFKDVYYLRINPSVQGQVSIPNLILVRLGVEPYGPEEEMYIAKDKILFWENLRADSEIVKTIISNRTSN